MFFALKFLIEKKEGCIEKHGSGDKKNRTKDQKHIKLIFSMRTYNFNKIKISFWIILLMILRKILTIIRFNGISHKSK
jgi:hypothetical protein